MNMIEFTGHLCTLASVCFQFVGIQICYGIIRKGGTGDMSPFTFITYFASSSLWLKYGLLQKIPVVIGVNGMSSSLNFIYMLIFYRYAMRKNIFHQYLMVGLVLLITPLLYVKYYQTSVVLAKQHLGSYVVFMSVLGYAAPLTSLFDVVKTRSTECLSFSLILANVGLAFVWTVYGGMIDDRYVQTPNFLGLILSLIQLSLFFIYPSSRSTTQIL